MLILSEMTGFGIVNYTKDESLEKRYQYIILFDLLMMKDYNNSVIMKKTDISALNIIKETLT